MSDCCHSNSHVSHAKKRPDYLLWGSLIIVGVSYFLFVTQFAVAIPYLSDFASSVYELMNKMWWGVLIGIIFVGIINAVPRDVLSSFLGKGGTFSGLLRAVFAGVLLDLCSHGILLVGMKLYQRGASLGQTMAFLIASPWNSFSLTLIIWALLGFKMMLVMLLLSMLIALVSGMIFDRLVLRGVLPDNPHSIADLKPASFKSIVTMMFRRSNFTIDMLYQVLRDGFVGSKMILKWIFFGVVIAALVRVGFSPENFQTYFGPTFVGLALTLIVATIMEVCSEGATPLAADFTTRAFAPGNTFAFLMTGVSTDYTEILALKETTGSWKIAFFLPFVTLPQVILLAYLLNNFSL